LDFEWGEEEEVSGQRSKVIREEYEEEAISTICYLRLGVPLRPWRLGGESFHSFLAAMMPMPA
jgi:hypothetical protein